VRKYEEIYLCKILCRGDSQGLALVGLIHRALSVMLSAAFRFSIFASLKLKLKYFVSKRKWVEGASR